MDGGALRKVLYVTVFKLPSPRISSKNLPFIRVLRPVLLLNSPGPLRGAEVTRGNGLLTRPKTLLPATMSPGQPWRNTIAANPRGLGEFQRRQNCSVGGVFPVTDTHVGLARGLCSARAQAELSDRLLWRCECP